VGCFQRSEAERSEVFVLSSFQEDRYCVAFFEGTAFLLKECMHAQRKRENVVVCFYFILLVLLFGM